MKAIKLKAERQVEKREINGVEFFISTSPYFFPDRLECSYDAESGTYTIGFRYLDNEPADEKPGVTDDCFEVRVGKHTGRILSVIVHVDRNDIHTIEMLVADRIPKALREAKGKKKERQLAENYRIAEEAMVSHGSELAQCVAAE